MTRIHPLRFGRRVVPQEREPSDAAGRVGAVVALVAAILYAICGDLVLPFFALAFTTIWRTGRALLDG